MRRRTCLRHFGGGLAGLAGGCSGLEGDQPGTTPGTRHTSTPTETPTPSDSPPPEETTSQEPQSFTADANWPEFQFDGANTGSHPTASGPTGGVTERWQYDAGISTLPVVADGRVYFGILNDELVALDERAGAEIWRAPVTRTVRGSPAVADGTVYVRVEPNRVSAFEAATGRSEWQVTTGPPPTPHADYAPRVRAGLTVTDGMVYVSSNDKLRALDGGTGRQRWQSRLEGLTAADGKSVYVTTGTKVYRLDKSDGTARWHTWVETSTAPTVADGRVYVGTGPERTENRVYALATSDGTERWQFDTTYQVAGIISAGETLYVMTAADAYDAVTGAVWAVDAATGAKRWRAPTDGWPQSPAMADGVLYTGLARRSDRPDHIVALRAADGTELWRSQLDSYQPNPVVVNETVYVTGRGVTALW